MPSSWLKTPAKIKHFVKFFVSIRFTRFLYAILSSKPLKSAPIYFRKNKFDFQQFKNYTKFNKKIIKNSFMNGIKIMIGFELFYEKCKKNINTNDNDKEWLKFKQSLIKKGYFNDHIPLSKSYKLREQKAKQYYNKNMKQPSNDSNSSFTVLFGDYACRKTQHLYFLTSKSTSKQILDLNI